MNQARQQKAEEHRSKVAPLIQALRKKGMTLREIAEVLNASGKRTAKGCDWQATQGQRVLRCLQSS
jgi:hypothetical protein